MYPQVWYPTTTSIWFRMYPQVWYPNTTVIWFRMYSQVWNPTTVFSFGLECTLKSGTPPQFSFGLECTLKPGTPPQFFHLVFNALSTTQYSFWSVQCTYSTCRMEDMDIGHEDNWFLIPGGGGP